MIEEVGWTSGATADLQAVYAYLEDTQAGSGDSLVAITDDLLALLRIFPEQGSVYSQGIRRLLVGRQKQYGLFYTVSGKRVHVLAFIDLRRDPDEIAKILRGRGID